MDGGRIAPAWHRSPEGFDLAQEMAFADAAEGGVARQGSDIGRPHGDERRPYPDP